MINKVVNKKILRNLFQGGVILALLLNTNDMGFDIYRMWNKLMDEIDLQAIVENAYGVILQDAMLHFGFVQMD